MNEKYLNFQTIAQVREANKKSEQYWFSKDTMKFFNCTIESELYRGGFFITSERMELGMPKEYTIRRVTNEKGNIETVGNFQQFSTLGKAQTVAKALSRMYHEQREDFETVERILKMGEQGLL